MTLLLAGTIGTSRILRNQSKVTSIAAAQALKAQGEGNEMWDVQWLESVDSTNTECVRRISTGSVAGLVIAAKHQTAGRGRLGRSWEDQGGGLLCSVVLPKSDPPFAMLASVGLAMRDAVAICCKTRLNLKWPNDLHGVRGKVAGMLSEGVDDLLVVGIGVNLLESNIPPSLAQVASSLEGEGAPAIPTADELLLEFLRCLSSGLTRADWRDRYELALSTIEQEVRVDLGTRSIVGRATGVGPSGELLVRTSEGPVAVAAGDVIHLRSDLPQP